MSIGGIDINFFRGAVLILLIIGFVGIWAWAWSRNRKEAFEEASMLPLEEDDGRIPTQDSKNEGSKE